MTTSEHGRALSELRLGGRWRESVAKLQEAALPGAAVAVTCNAPFGGGGLGRHLQEIVQALDRLGRPRTCICSAAPTGTPSPADIELRLPWLSLAQSMPPMRFSTAWRTWMSSVTFDWNAVRHLPACEHLIVFNGQGLAQLRATRRRSGSTLGVVSANSHLRRVARLHAQAHAQYPLERSWTVKLVGRNCEEYQRADLIYVASRYAWESFVEEGVSEEVLRLFPLSPDPRYEPAGASPSSATFNIVYVGSLTVAKGVPLLLDAFQRLRERDARLILVGGPATRGMRQAIDRACAKDDRIKVSPGDPLPHLLAAHLCVHPSYEDGFAYAPAEALACGVPVIVSEDTGMKELVDQGRNGLVVPTGDLPALAETIAAAYRGELFQ